MTRPVPIISSCSASVSPSGTKCLGSTSRGCSGLFSLFRFSSSLTRSTERSSSPVASRDRGPHRLDDPLGPLRAGPTLGEHCRKEGAEEKVEDALDIDIRSDLPALH